MYAGWYDKDQEVIFTCETYPALFSFHAKKHWVFACENWTAEINRVEATVWINLFITPQSLIWNHNNSLMKNKTQRR